jgi:hypothetical protein
MNRLTTNPKNLIGQAVVYFMFKYKKILKVSILILFFFITGSVYAKTLHFTDWMTDITIYSDSTLFVRESQTVDFTGSSGFFKRNIALQNLKKITNVNVYDEKGIKLNENEVDVQYNPDKIRIKVRALVNEKKTWIIEYRVYGGIRFLKDRNEFKWEVVDTEKHAPIDKIETLVCLPCEIPNDKIKQRLLIGEDGAEGKSENYTALNASTLKYWGEDIGPYENFTIAVSLPRGIFSEEQKRKIKPYLWFLIPLFTFVVFYWKWWIGNRDPILKRLIVSHSQPPDDISPAALYALVYGKMALKGITATLIDLANRGCLRVIEKDRKGRLTPYKIYSFQKLWDYDDHLSLKEHERLILSSLFTTQETVILEKLRDTFRRNIPRINRVVWNELTKGGYITKSPRDIKRKHTFRGLLILALGFFSLGILHAAGIAFLLTGLVMIAFGRHISYETKKGKDAKWQALGFKKYLSESESDLDDDLTPEVFVNYLPYAILFGLDKEWVKCFVNIQEHPPEWYVSAHDWTTLSILEFANVLSSVTGGSSLKH